MPDLQNRGYENLYDVRGDVPYIQVLAQAQAKLSGTISGDVENLSQSALKDLIQRYITDNNVKCRDVATLAELVDYIYHDMAGLSFISRDKLFERDGFEEININAWDDVEVTSNGRPQKTDYSFLSPQHAIDIHQRMFRASKTLFNETGPRATADIGEGIRITAQRYPIVDKDIALVSSIRKVNMTVVNQDKLLGGKTLTPLMFDFLMLCLEHGVSMCVSGETGAGKTTLAGCLLSIASAKLRTYTIEEGSREWNFVRRDENGKATNSVIHTKTKPNEENPALNIDQEALVKDSLRFDPDIIAPGEIRGREAFEIMGVSNTGHTVITTIHSNGTADTPARMVTLAKKAFDMTDSTLFGMAARAFPILVHMELGADRRRRVSEIREVTGYQNGEVQSQMLFEFIVDDNICEGDTCVLVDGRFQQLAPISEAMVKRMLKKGARRAQLEPYSEFEREASTPWTRALA